jgi:hypothetical protein
MYVAGLVAAFPDLAFAVKRISVDGDRQPEGTASVVGFFNQKTFVEQLGLQALIVFRKGESPLPFGMSVRSDPGNTAEPGALTMTSIDVDSDQSKDQEQAEVQLRSLRYPHQTRGRRLLLSKRLADPSVLTAKTTAQPSAST